MTIGVPKETQKDEKRVALTPETAGRIQKLGYKLKIQKGAGADANFSDEAYRDAGVEVVDRVGDLWKNADIIMKVRPPSDAEVNRLGPGKTLISFLYPGQNEDLLKKLNDKKPEAVMAMDMVPRISRAQKLDALSSMANIAGYRAVVEAANNFGRFFTGQVTAAGKVPPAVILVIGAGVAGLAAIGAARGMGAIVRSFDIRPEVAEQIESMGAEFLFLDFEGEQGGTEGGYAKPSSPEFREKQLELFRAQAPEVDIVITTALIPGRPAPKLWLKDMVEAMKPGSVIVDLAAEQGGNCDLTVPGEKIVTDNEVTIVGYTDFASRMAAQSSQLYGTNLRHLLDDLTPAKDGRAVIDMEDTVIRGVTVSKAGEITYPPPPVSTSVAPKAPPAPKADPAEEARKAEAAAAAKARTTGMVFGGAAILLALIGLTAPSEFLSYFMVFVLAVIVGYYVIWNVTPALHTPLMAVTNAISGIIVIGALLQISSSSVLVLILAAFAVLIATINISGGFLVTRRMLAMFQRS
ncbi:MAG: Re/Si-specific NAD(P)(+) transhydrogenase subunit alpha [Alphaproteobacteria bacterium]